MLRAGGLFYAESGIRAASSDFYHFGARHSRVKESIAPNARTGLGVALRASHGRTGFTATLNGCTGECTRRDGNKKAAFNLKAGIPLNTGPQKLLQLLQVNCDASVVQRLHRLLSLVSRPVSRRLKKSGIFLIWLLRFRECWAEISRYGLPVDNKFLYSLEIKSALPFSNRSRKQS